jgi:CMP/dCMP kinase
LIPNLASLRDWGFFHFLKKIRYTYSMAKITLFGMAGTGKGTIRDLLKQKLGYEKSFSCGDFERQVAKNKGITLLEMDELAKTDKTIDMEQDTIMEEFGKNNSDFIVEGRLAWYFIPDSFKIALLCDFDGRIQRIANREGKEIATVEAETREREKAIYERFATYYGITDLENPANFDLSIDTTNLTPDQIADLIVSALQHKSLI